MCIFCVYVFLSMHCVPLGVYGGGGAQRTTLGISLCFLTLFSTGSHAVIQLFLKSPVSCLSSYCRSIHYLDCATTSGFNRSGNLNSSFHSCTVSTLSI